MRVSCLTYFIKLKPKFTVDPKNVVQERNKNQKEYGHRGKESIHSFRKTMHVREHQPLLQQQPYEHTVNFFELTTINLEHKRQLMDKEVKCLPIKHNNRFHYLK